MAAFMVALPMPVFMAAAVGFTVVAAGVGTISGQR